MILLVRLALAISVVPALVYIWLSAGVFRYVREGGTIAGLLLLALAASCPAISYLAHLSLARGRPTLALVLCIVSLLMGALLMIVVPAVAFGIANP